MSAGRRPHDEPHRKKTFYLPESLVTKVDIALELDLVRGTAKHGSLSALVASLLRNWLAEQIEFHKKTKEQEEYVNRISGTASDPPTVGS